MSVLKCNSIWKWLGNCQCKYQIKTPRIGPLRWVIYVLYFKLYKLCISIWILKNKPGKSNNSLVKNVYSRGMLVQSLAKDQITIRLDSVGILTFLKQSMWNKSENVCLNYKKNTAWICILQLTAPCCFGHLSCFSTIFEEEKPDWSTSYISSPILGGLQSWISLFFLSFFFDLLF